jgi:hypothetical protein
MEALAAPLAATLVSGARALRPSYCTPLPQVLEGGTQYALRGAREKGQGSGRAVSLPQTMHIPSPTLQGEVIS